MNYGYNSLGKTADKILAKRLTELVSNLPPGTSRQRPYIEINGLYPGVRIRKLTELTEAQLNEFIESADKIHESVCIEFNIS